MIATIVTVHVLPGQEDAFLAASLANHRGARCEKGNIRFDVLRDNRDPACFYLYEVYADEKAAAAHKQTAHYLLWRETVAPMMATPRTAAPTTPQAFD